MSSVIDPNPEPTPADELVAYLDGELAPDECRRVEQRLSADPEYRQQLRDLDQAWEALAALPASKVDDGFARTTIELATVAAEGELSQQKSHVAAHSRRTWKQWILGATAAAMLGFLAGRLLLPNRDARLLADLPVIMHADTLAHVDNMEFLHKLTSAVPLSQLATDEEAIARQLAELKAASSPTVESRRQWVEQLPTDDKAQLATEAAAFQNLPRSQQQQMRRVFRDIAAAGDADKKTLLAYGQWLSELTPGKLEQLREDFEDRPVDEQVNQVADLVRHEEERESQRLSADDERRLREEIQRIAEGRREAWQRLTRRREGQASGALEPGQALYILLVELRNPERREATRERLVGVLSPAAQEHWQRLDRRPGDASRLRSEQLGRWIREALKPEWGPTELEAFFASDDLSNDDRERLLNMTTSEMHETLQRMYLAREYKAPGADWPTLVEPGRRPGGARGDGRGWRPDGPPRENPDRGQHDYPGRRGAGRNGSGPPPHELRGPPQNFGPRDRRPPPPPDGRPPGGPPPHEAPPRPDKDRPQPI
jgi:hypothetical protein